LKDRVVGNLIGHQTVLEKLNINAFIHTDFCR
jgi:hypothetical protein